MSENESSGITSRALSNQTWFWPSLLLFAIAVLYGLLIKPHVVGFEYDDGLYVMASESLAKGHGFHLPYLLGNPALVKYPPLFPLALAPIWWFAPDFPANVPWFKVLNITFFLGFLALFWNYAKKIEALPSALSILLISFIGFNFVIARTVTNVFSEPLYLLLLMLLIWELHREKARLALVILLSVALFYTRTFGILAFAGLALWQVLLPAGESRWPRKQLLVYIGACLMLMFPWFWWQSQQTPPPLKIDGFEIRPFNSGYLIDLFEALQSQEPISLYFDGWAAQMEAFGSTLFTLVPPPIAFVLGSLLLLVLLKRLIAFCKQKAFGFAGCYVILSLLALPFWIYHDQYSRLLLPILPLLLLYLVSESRLVHNGTVKAVIIGAVFFCHSMSLGGWLAHYRGDTLLSEVPKGFEKKAGDPLWQDFQDTVKFAQDLHSAGGVVPLFWTHHNAVAYSLYTRLPFPDSTMILWRGPIPKDETSLKALARRRTVVLYQWLKSQKIRFVVANVKMQMGRITADWDEVTHELVKMHPQELQLIYTTPNNMVWVYERGDTAP